MLASSLSILQCIPPDNPEETLYDFEEILAFFLSVLRKESYLRGSCAYCTYALSISNTDYWLVFLIYPSEIIFF